MLFFSCSFSCCSVKEKKEKKADDADEDSLDPSQYFENRVREIEELSAAGKKMYPHKFKNTMSVPQFVAQYEARKIETGARLGEEEVQSIAGRVYSKRAAGHALIFFDVQSQGGRIQVIADKKTYTDDWDMLKHMKRGDIIGIVGVVGKSNTGELSIFPSSITLLTPCLRMLPNKHSGLKDQETRYRQRYLDLMLNQHVRKNFFTRAKIINYGPTQTHSSLPPLRRRLPSYSRNAFLAFRLARR